MAKVTVSLTFTTDNKAAKEQLREYIKQALERFGQTLEPEHLLWRGFTGINTCFRSRVIGLAIEEPEWMIGE